MNGVIYARYSSDNHREEQNREIATQKRGRALAFV